MCVRLNCPTHPLLPPSPTCAPVLKLQFHQSQPSILHHHHHHHHPQQQQRLLCYARRHTKYYSFNTPTCGCLIISLYSKGVPGGINIVRFELLRQLANTHHPQAGTTFAFIALPALIGANGQLRLLPVSATQCALIQFTQISLDPRLQMMGVGGWLGTHLYYYISRLLKPRTTRMELRKSN